MSTPVLICPFISMPYRTVGKTLSEQLFHLNWCSIPENRQLATPVHPRAVMSNRRIPDGYK